MPKIRDLLKDGIRDAEVVLAAPTLVSPADGEEVDDSGGSSSEPEGLHPQAVALPAQRKERYSRWLASIDDMASANMPTPLTRLELQTRHGGEPRFCSMHDDHYTGNRFLHSRFKQSSGHSSSKLQSHPACVAAASESGETED